ncbi:MAG TPA: methylated-DNA--[protein]-cysteine S-methyltransferase [Allosphingosinicella sp.]|nr:methylated-DNA--[protein]-cysteine S-methyltransferase [Allosphingosinicella sp.]
MRAPGLALFDTRIGACGIAWRESAIAGLQLPEGREATAMARLRRRFPEFAPAAPPPWVERVIAAVRDHLAGSVADLEAVPLDFAGIGAFEAAVYRAAQQIPAGTTTTYGALARRLGDPHAARAVGQALGRNPWPIVIPCHRVTAADGRAGGFSAPGGRSTKLRLLEIEGALAAATLPLFARKS